VARQHFAILKYNLITEHRGIQVLSPALGVAVCSTLIWIGLGNHAFVDTTFPKLSYQCVCQLYVGFAGMEL
jgi:hypothetical protein